ncbi:ATP-binding protein [Streptomyces sp. NPDC005805]|uniref:ATP-binding protein n=1 Tax=Streptomyces sp. NPDC005805 TaxID=3157068 RepID=UPI0033C6A5EB
MQHEALRELFCRRERRSVGRAREFAREALDAWGWEGARAGDVLLCVSELATNALVHGVPPGRGYLVRLLNEDAGRRLRVEVHDSGDGRPALAPPGGTRPEEDESGRRLLLVAALADTWGVGERDPGKVVWCAFTRGRT